MKGLYEQTVAIARPYLGVAAERFMARQCIAHLSVQPENLTKAQLDELARWVEISSKLLIDEGKAREFKNRILALK